MTDTRQMETAFARELARALDESPGGRIEIDRVVLDAPRAELARPGGLRDLARAAARELRKRVRGE